MYKGWNPKQDFMHLVGGNIQYSLGLMNLFIMKQ